ncbi:exosortase/archaeosortase family protein [Puniceicoccus vermicola]|uniref:Exosortase/archaeosortase family protein n=1 Tax=Puniceicoccus vermicola TaxID=388746 RepID=A0A7X1B0C1_9BACT|nr:exosortase/archaeosortase family protein [Puniceicoccus vermicola]MBC2603129.1 exosortase/archaeosortase family protein [Puniceicoccus vermicola]
MKRSFAANRKLIALLCLVSALALSRGSFPLLTDFFIFPVGYLASWTVGTVPELVSGGVQFTSTGTQFLVSQACSGIVFFGLLVAMAALVAPTPRRLIQILPYIYLYAVASNVARIVFWTLILPPLEAFFNPRYLTPGHELAGAIVYLPAAILAQFLLSRHFERKRPEKPEATEVLSDSTSLPDSLS